MLWLIIAIISYLILAVVFLVDKFLLAGSISNPKVYTFYVGVLGILALLIVPFAGFSIPEPSQIVLSILAGAFFVCGLFWFYKALQLFEPSRAVPAIGGILPIFTLLLVYFFSGGKEALNFREFLIFILLISGSVLITCEKGKIISLKGLGISSISAFLLAVYFVLMKYVYLEQSFWSGFIWIKIGSFLAALCFLILSKEIQKELFKKREKVDLPAKTATIFLSNQAVGAGANVLQNWAIALAPLVFVAFVNALQGIQYVFLFIFAIFLSLKFPRILKEEISRGAIFQKIVAILLIAGGLAILALK